MGGSSAKLLKVVKVPVPVAGEDVFCFDLNKRLSDLSSLELAPKKSRFWEFLHEIQLGQSMQGFFKRYNCNDLITNSLVR